MVKLLDGSSLPALVSLPCPLFVSRAQFIPGRHRPLAVQPNWRLKALRAARLTLSVLGRGAWGGRLTVASQTPPGWGLGSSTSDVTAAVRAVADAFDLSLTDAQVARIAVLAETASDSTMFSGAVVLFAHRRGRVLEQLGRRWPGLEVLGWNSDPERAGVDTVGQGVPRYREGDMQAFHGLLESLRRAFQRGDRHLLGSVATESACLNQRLLPKPGFDEVRGIARATGACGVQVAHSGTVMGLLFAAGAVDEVAEARRLLHKMGVRDCWRFQIGHNQGGDGGTA